MKEGYDSRRKGGSDHNMRREHKFVNVLGHWSSLLGYGRGKDGQLTPQLRRQLLLCKASHKSLSVKLWSGSTKVLMCNVNYASEYRCSSDSLDGANTAPSLVDEPLPGAN